MQNRSFAALVALALAAFVVLGLTACAVVAASVQQLLTDAPVLGAAGWGLWSALLLAVLNVAAVSLVLLSVNRQLVATERLARRVRASRQPPPPRLLRIATDLRLHRRLDVVESDEPFAFTYGFLAPRVAISHGLVDLADDQELRAVLVHERHHVRAYDPLKTILARALPDAVLFLPTLRDLRARYLLGRELAADERAIAACGPGAVAGALVKVLDAPASWEPVAGAALGGAQLLPARVLQLEQGRQPPPQPLSNLRMGVSAAAFAALLALVSVAARALPHGIAQVHADMAVIPATPLAAIGTAVCVSGSVWVGWRVLRWMSSKPRGPASP